MFHIGSDDGLFPRNHGVTAGGHTRGPAVKKGVAVRAERLEIRANVVRAVEIDMVDFELTGVCRSKATPFTCVLQVLAVINSHAPYVSCLI